MVFCCRRRVSRNASSSAFLASRVNGIWPGLWPARSRAPGPKTASERSRTEARSMPRLASASKSSPAAVSSERSPVVNRSTLTSVLRSAVAAGPSPSDRKSTRLNSSHANISYAVFRLKKNTSISYPLSPPPSPLLSPYRFFYFAQFHPCFFLLPPLPSPISSHLPSFGQPYYFLSLPSF